MAVTPPSNRPSGGPPINLNKIMNEISSNDGFNPAATFQMGLKVNMVQNVRSDKYIVFETEVPQQQQRVPKTTPSRIGGTPTSSPYEIPSTPSTPVPKDFGIKDLNRVRYERPNAKDKKNNEPSYDVDELRKILLNINNYLRERGLPRISTSSHRDDYVTAIHQFFGTTAPDQPSGKGAKLKAKAPAKEEVKSIQLVSPSSKGTSLKTRKKAESESEEDSDIEELSSKLSQTSISKGKSNKPAPKISLKTAKKAESESESEERSESESEEEKPKPKAKKGKVKK